MTQLYRLATLPHGNPNSLEDFETYDLTPIDHEYPGRFAKKANHVFRSLDLPIGFAMVVADPKEADAVYDNFRKDPKYRGGGTGSGFKNKAPAFLDVLDPLARRIDAVNVVVKKDGALHGYNTDGTGFVFGLKELFAWEKDIHSLMGAKVLLVGAGGTADAIAFALAGELVQLDIVNRTAEKAVKLAERITHTLGIRATGYGEDALARLVPDADIIINASTKSAEGPLKDFAALSSADGDLEHNLRDSERVIATAKRSAVVCDVNLRDSVSPTLSLAKQYGLLTQDGRAMNFHQAVEALWLIHADDFRTQEADKRTVARLIEAVS
ncbi:MAG: hypothetical protein AAB388_01545 [Patescibacteria group bacterium]